MKIALLLLSLLAVAAARKRPRIHNGRVVSQKEVESIYPFVVGITLCGKGCIYCTGSLVSRDTVLTAAHCVCNTRSIHVHFKTTSLWSGGTKLSAQVKWVHRKHRCGTISYKLFQNDIATLKLSRPITDITPVRLDCRNERVGEYVTIIGFGTDERGHLGTLKMGYQRVIECPYRHVPIICSDENDRRQDLFDAGDSGGPLLVRSGSGFKQLGIQVGKTTWKIKPIRGRTTNKVMVFNQVSTHCQQIFK